MKIALDTNRYTDFCQGEPTATEIIARAAQIFLPFAIPGELRAGFQAGTRPRQNESILIRFLNSPRVRILFPDEQTTHHYASIYARLRKQGKPIPTNDIWIAALVLQHDLLLATRDRHFDYLPELPRI